MTPPKANVFYGDDEHERPYDERGDADEFFRIDAAALADDGGNGFAEGIKGAGADVAVYHPYCADGEAELCTGGGLVLGSHWFIKVFLLWTAFSALPYKKRGVVASLWWDF